MASLTIRRMPSAKPLEPSSLRSCKTACKSSGLLWWVILVLSWSCLLAPQQKTMMAQPRPVFCARSAPAPLGLGCARLALIPPRPKEAGARGRKIIYRNRFTPTAYARANEYDNSYMPNETGNYAVGMMFPTHDQVQKLLDKIKNDCCSQK